MGGDGVDDFVGFAITLDEISASDGVRAFDFVVDGFANVMKEPGALGGGDVKTEFGGHEAHEMGNFDGVVEDVLGVAVAKVEAAKDFEDFEVERREAGLGDGFVGEAKYSFVHLFVDLGDDFFDSAGMDAAIED
jgi:hypothetical protein